jgi:hypothetical protein
MMGLFAGLCANAGSWLTKNKRFRPSEDAPLRMISWGAAAVFAVVLLVMRVPTNVLQTSLVVAVNLVATGGFLFTFFGSFKPK